MGLHPRFEVTNFPHPSPSGGCSKYSRLSMKLPQLLTFLTYLVLEHFASTMKMEAAGSAETSVTTSQTGARQSTEDRSLNIYCRHNLLSYSQWFMSQTAPTCNLNRTWNIRKRGCSRGNLLLTLGPGMYCSFGVTIRRHIGYCEGRSQNVFT